TVSPDLPGADDITRRAPTPRTADRLAVGFHRGTVRSGNRGTVRVRRLLVGQDLRAVEVPRAEATRVRRPESGRLQMTPVGYGRASSSSSSSGASSPPGTSADCSAT